MKKVKVQVCEGTTCFVMGGDTIKSMLTTIAEKYKDKVEITSVRCLGTCNKSDSFSKAPYVVVDNEEVSSADLEKVMSVIERKLNNE